MAVEALWRSRRSLFKSMHLVAAFVTKTVVETYCDNANLIKYGVVMLLMETFKSIWKCIWLKQFLKMCELVTDINVRMTETMGPMGLGDSGEKRVCVSNFSLTPKPFPPIHLTPTLTIHSSNPHPPPTLPPPTYLTPTTVTTHPTNPTPTQLTFRPWPDLAHLTPTHFSLSPYPTPPPSFPHVGVYS